LATDKRVSVAPFADLSGRTAVVTGSSSGIGRAVALEFARAGADVVVHCDQSTTAAEAVAAEIRDLGRRAQVLTADLGMADQLPAFCEAAWRCFGSVNLWMNNAGVDLLTGQGAKLGYPEKLARLLEVDVQSTILLSHLVGRRLSDAGRGVILNIGWDQADRGMEGASGELFAASKNAVMGFTRSLAVSLAPRVRVNCIAPGWIRTAWGEGAGEIWQARVRDETPLKRWGTPEDVAKMARFLASDDADFVTGQVICVNGGAVR
jgi:3-oxoacyl-[acyl-carrier protein] reductase